MSIFFGSGKGETITPDHVSPSVRVIGFGKKPSAGTDLIFAGRGDDVVAGGGGNDIASLGRGNDRFIWNNGDGSDLVMGNDGFDTLEFNSTSSNESVEISADNGATLLKRDIGDITMVMDGMERIELATFGGSDSVLVRDLSSTGIKEVAIDLAGTRNGTSGDGAVDSIVLEGEDLPAFIEVFQENGKLIIDDLPVDVTIANAEAHDRLRINGGDARDVISAGQIAAGVMQFTLDGGGGNDTLHGSDGNDELIGGDGHDFVIGNRGDDIAYLGDGRDGFVWDPGDGSDTVEGGADNDRLHFNGANVSETVEIAANGERVRFVRQPGNITMDLNDMEQIIFNALGGEDVIAVRDLTGTDATQIDISLASSASPITGDGEDDLVTIDGTINSDNLKVTSAGNTVTVSGLAATVNVSGADAAQDIVAVLSGGGDDKIDASGLAAGMTQLHIVAGDGNDEIIGSQGNDEITGGRGADVAHMGAGDDVFVWAPGDGSDVVEGGAGFDTMMFNGAAANETVEISANGARAVFFRQPGNITMDLNDVENVTFNALGGADDIVVRDLTGTGVQEITLNLSDQLLGTTPDGALDRMTIAGTDNQDFIEVVGAGGSLAIIGTPALVRVERFDTTDELTIAGGHGDDQISASTVNADALRMTIDGGEGNDVLSGGAGDDVLIGGEGHDVLIGGLGDDTFIDLGGMIEDFVAGAGSPDRLDLRSLGLSFEEVMAHASDVNGDVVFDFGGGDELTLASLSVSQLHQDDFILA